MTKYVYLVKVATGSYEDSFDYLKATFFTFKEALEYAESIKSIKDVRELENIYNDWVESLPEEYWEMENLSLEDEFLKTHPEWTAADLDEMYEATSFYEASSVDIYLLTLGNPAREELVGSATQYNPNLHSECDNYAWRFLIKPEELPTE